MVLFLKGMAMGAADVVPGVSGGTIAFISGIYEELLESINNINLTALKKWKQEGVKSFWAHINGNFLTALFKRFLNAGDSLQGVNALKSAFASFTFMLKKTVENINIQKEILILFKNEVVLNFIFFELLIKICRVEFIYTFIL